MLTVESIKFQDWCDVNGYDIEVDDTEESHSKYGTTVKGYIYRQKDDSYALVEYTIIPLGGIEEYHILKEGLKKVKTQKVIIVNTYF